MKMAKKLLAVVLAGVLALSVLTGCGNAASTKTIADAMSDMGKNEGVVYKADSKLNEKARLIAEKLSTYEDEEESLAAILEEDKEEGSEGEGPNLEEEIPTIVMDIMGADYKDKYVWIATTPTKGYNVTAQAYNLYEQMEMVNENTDRYKAAAAVRYIGTATVTVNGEGYRLAVITADAVEVDKNDKTDVEKN